MTVYCVFSYEYDTPDLHNIFLDQRMAHDHAEFLNKANDTEDFHVVNWEVNATNPV